MAHTFNSQIPGSSQFTLSPPSEPPDITNWFASYKFESFVLDTSDNFGDCIGTESKEANREKEKNLGDFRRVRNSCEVGQIGKNIYSNGSLKFNDSFENDKILDLSGTPSGLSVLSEPPDIRNWFSSYVYESPVMSSNGDPRGIVSKSESEEDGVVIRDSKKEWNENSGAIIETANSDQVGVGEKPFTNGLVKCNNFSGDRKHESRALKKISDSLHSSSHPSEPADIRNWCSSYVYESPVFGSSDKFGDSIPEEAEYEKDGFFNEESDNEDGDRLGIISSVRYRYDVGERLLSNAFVRCNSSLGYNEQQQSISKANDGVKGKEKLPARNALCLEKVSEQSMGGENLATESISSIDNLKVTTLNDENSLYIQGQEYPQEPDFLSSDIKRSSGSEYNRSSNPLFNRRDFTQTEKVNYVSPGSNVKLTPLSGTPMKHGSNGKENKGTKVLENGFLTVRKNKIRRANDENSSRNMLSECSKSKGTVLSDGEKETARKEEPLSESTNLQHSDVMAVTGKWRCPQKNRPNLGPPLKQLRLERWIHRL
ncbi:hypothetical protein CFOL_v3_32419 [Cephalotus follicularis]|uniref:Uncharacterized protein n=1 Tax=Cephalotus follicularis TaxID=3775 RepID=A0A1Q3D9R1_CEPFO|nr:hypothetical protein CFOL_v3_32419 [Cephalotus follicularis]